MLFLPFKGLIWLMMFISQIYVNLWLRWRGYRPVSAAEYIRLVDAAPERKKRSP